LRRYWFFFNFRNCRCRHLGFWNREILLAIGMERIETHQRAKFRQNQSIGCEDIKIFRFFKMAAAAILDFQICEILLADGFWRAQTHNCTKFHQNRSFRCGDIPANTPARVPCGICPGSRDWEGMGSLYFSPIPSHRELAIKSERLALVPMFSLHIQ